VAVLERFLTQTDPSEKVKFTRNQAVARIADRTALQLTWLPGVAK